MAKRIQKSFKTRHMTVLEKNIMEKEEVEFEEDLYALTVLCYLKTNAEHFQIPPEKHAQNLYNTF